MKALVHKGRGVKALEQHRMMRRYATEAHLR
jgi:hypothetical protein